MAENYQPISCAVHDDIESAILRRVRVELCWMEVNEQRCVTALLLDVGSRQGVEYLTFRTAERVLEIRLDQISAINSRPVSRPETGSPV